MAPQYERRCAWRSARRLNPLTSDTDLMVSTTTSAGPAAGTSASSAAAADHALPWPANPASVDPDKGCPAWQAHMGAEDEVMCASTIVAIIDDLPNCGWCTEAYLRGAA